MEAIFVDHRILSMYYCKGVVHLDMETTSSSTGCPRKNTILTLEAYNLGLESYIEKKWGSFEILMFSAFI